MGVRPHLPLIKFPNRHIPDASPKSLQSSTPPTVLPSTVHTKGKAPQVTEVSTSSTGGSHTTKPIGSLPRGTGVEHRFMPEKYRRKLLSDEEIDFILRGGPE